ncbi:MAG: FecR domain-containing protein [Coprococcus sp.]|nr:FecR domain-containing protein [Coprococcus sp.]
MKRKRTSNVMVLFVTIVLLCIECTACGGQETTEQQEVLETQKTKEMQGTQKTQESGTASVMELFRSQGNVGVTDDEGEDVSLIENMHLYSGYDLKTERESFAWINLDSVKLAKMDAASEIEIQKSGKDLAILVNNGSVFFHVTRPLEEDETMEIRTSTMTVGIRGTCGWVEDVDENHMKVYILEGKVECSIAGESIYVSAGEMAEMAYTKDGKGEFTADQFDESAIPEFVWVELDEEMLAGFRSLMEETGESERSAEEQAYYDTYFTGTYFCDATGATLTFSSQEGVPWANVDARPGDGIEDGDGGLITGAGVSLEYSEWRDGVLYAGDWTLTRQDGQIIVNHPHGELFTGVFHR